MFRPMRREKQQLSDESARQVLLRGKTGVLSLLGDDGYPYGVPVNYCLYGNAIYIHCAPVGHKIDAVRNCPKASFCVVDEERINQPKYATDYRSVILFGQVCVVSDPEELTRALIVFTDKYCPDMGHEANVREVELEKPGVTLLRLEIEHVTGKEGKHLRGSGDSMDAPRA